MRFGLFSLFDFHPERQDETSFIQESLELFVLGEKLGFSSAWIGEEHFYAFGICPNPVVFLAALAQRTNRMRLGTAITLTQFQNPLRLAEDYAMLDVLSGGRVDLGLGRGSFPIHFAGFEVDIDDSVQRHREAIDVVRAAWSTRSLSHDGHYWRFPELSVSPRPIQRPHPPIYQATVSPESFEHAGRLGDGAFIVPGAPATSDALKERLAIYHKAAADHGREVPAPVFIYQLFLNHSREAGEEEARACMGAYWDRVAAAAGNAGIAQARKEQMKDNLHESAMIGTPAEVIDRLKAVRAELGAEHVAFYLNAGARTAASARANLEMFATEVLPAVQDL
jgi:alkanesulfonate monooxygenase SsuD/methylene tetrahydromethanopterin reductase-like flavin-dependent oxidoreductase (luciferase family)